MINSIKKFKKGFTLAEVLIGLTIFTVITGLIYNMLIGGKRQYFQSRTFLEALQDIRVMFGFFKNDVRHAIKIRIFTAGPTKNVELTFDDGSKVTYLYNDKKVIRQETGFMSKKYIWNNIKDFIVAAGKRYFKKDGSLLSETPPSSKFANITIDNSITNPSAYYEFFYLKIEVNIKKKFKQKKEVKLSTYVYPRCIDKLKKVRWRHIAIK